MNNIKSLQESFRSGDSSPSELLKKSVEQIQKLEMFVHAWEFLDLEHAQRDAIKMDQQVKDGGPLGPLHGIPLGVKDIIDVNDLPTKAGCKSWTGNLARQDADCVRMLRKAGAIILGKTVTTPYASFDPPPTVNPWNQQRTPGGSSSGSAAAIATQMVPLALGTQTGGSITRPAAYCGVCSIKPSYGWISMEGILPLSPSMDHLGFMANNMEDLGVIFQALSSPQPAISGFDFRLPIGFLKGFFWDKLSPDIKNLISETRIALEKQGVVFKDIHLPDNALDILKHHRKIMAHEAFRVHAFWIERRPWDYPEKITSLIDEGRKVSNMEYLEALNQKEVWKTWFENQMQHLEGLFSSATLTVAPDRTNTGDPALNSPWSFTGLPTISLPVGFNDEKLPFSIQIAGRCNQDLRLINLGIRLENLLNWKPLLPSHLARFL